MINQQQKSTKKKDWPHRWTDQVLLHFDSSVKKNPVKLGKGLFFEYPIAGGGGRGLDYLLVFSLLRKKILKKKEKKKRETGKITQKKKNGDETASRFRFMALR